MNPPTSWLDRYRAIGLRNNPFALDDATINESRFVDRGLGSGPQPQASTVVQVIGDRGFGKTTHLEHWRGTVPGPYFHVPFAPYRHRWRRPPMAPIVYGDEVDRLPSPVRRQWLRHLARAGSSAVIGTHVDLARSIRGAGLDVVTHRLEPVALDTLRRIVDARLADAALSPDEIPVVFSDDDLADVNRQSGGSIRAAEVLCHQLLAQLVD